MPKGQKFKLPGGCKFQVVDGQDFIRLRDAAKLSGISATVLEMGKELITRVGGSGVAFPLSTPELQKASDQVAATIKLGLRRFAKAMEPNRGLKVKAFKDPRNSRLVFWYVGKVS